MLYDRKIVGGCGGVGFLLKLLLVFAISLTGRVMTISKSFKLSSAPTCQNAFFSRLCVASPPLDTAKRDKYRRKKGDEINLDVLNLWMHVV